MEAKNLKELLSQLPAIRDAAMGLSDMILANLVMLGEIPAPTFGEEARIGLLQQRFSECGLQNSSSDEAGNGLGILPGTEEEENILVVAHADTLFPETVDHNITLHANRAIGPGIADNSLALAVLASLPTLLEHLDIRLRSNLILMGASRSLGRGNLEGLRFFLSNNKLPIRAGVCVEGVHLGRLSFSSVGMVRGEITCTVPKEYDWSRFGDTSAILTINEVINKIAKIRLPKKPRSNILLGSLMSGISFDTPINQAVLRFEIRSEARDIVRDATRQIEDIVAEISALPDADVKLDIIARRRPIGIGFTHPLPRVGRRIQKKLGIAPKVGPSMSELSALINHKIPAITIGLTSGEQLHEEDETIFIEPLYIGIAQLVGILLAIDGGLCDED